MFARSVLRRIPFSPITGKDPKFVHDAPYLSRKGKDIFDGAHHLLNATGLYNNVLKHTGRYWAFVITTSMVGTWAWCRAWDRFWIKTNKGKLSMDTTFHLKIEEDDEE